MVNTPGTPGGENGDNIEKLKEGQKQPDNKQKFIKDFIEENYNSENKDRVAFLNGIMKGNDVDSVPELKDKLKKYLESNSKIDSKKYEGVKIEDIKISELKEGLRNDFIRINSKRYSLRKIFKDDFEIDDKVYNSKISGEIEKLDDKELGKLLDSDILREDFLKKIFKDSSSVPKRKKIAKLLDHYNLKEVFEKQNGNAQMIFIGILDKVIKGQKLQQTDFQALFEAGYFNKEQKKEIISNFIPTISLKKAIELKIISDEKVQKFKNIVLEKYFKDINESIEKLEDIDREIFLKNIKTEDVLIQTKNLLTDLNFVDAILENNYKIITNEYNRFFDKLKTVRGDDVEDLGGEDIESVDGKKETSPEGVKKYNNFLKNLKATGKVTFEDEFDETESKFKSGTDAFFKKGDIIQINEICEVEDPDGKGKTKIIKPKFLEIANVDSDNEIITAYSKGIDKYRSGGDIGEKNEFSFKQFLTFIKKGSTDGKGNIHTINNVVIIDPSILATKIFKKDIIEDLENSEESLVDKLYDENRGILEKFYEETDEYKNLIIDNSTDYEARKWLEEKIYEEELDIDTDEIKKLKLENKELKKFSYEKLIDALDEVGVDPEGSKYGLQVGTAFETSRGSIYTVSKVDEISGEIVVDSPKGLSSHIVFQDFFTAFKETGSKRTTKVSNTNELIHAAENHKKVGSKWSSFEIKNDGIYNKKTNSEFEYDFLVSDDGEELIKIHSFVGSDKVNISFGNFKAKEIEKKDKNDIQKYDNTFGVENEKYTVSLGFLHTWIQKYKLVPRSLDEEKDVKEEEIKTENLKGSIRSKIFKRYSISELIAGGKLGIDGIEQYLKEGNEEHAAKFAQSVFGRFLPDEVESDLITRVETAGKKRMDDYVQKLSDIDSGPATEMIKKWLFNKDCPQYKKEAGLTFMIQKYGVLYAKSGLADYRGKFLWYEALGGKVGDELYLQKKADAEADDVPFAEEELIYVLLVKQCKKGGYNGIQRRSRLHKEFKKFRATAKDDEYASGVADGGDMRTIEGRLKGAMGELRGGTYPNAYGFYETVVGKGGPMELMNQVPFIMCFSGIAYGFEQKMLDQIKNFPHDGRLIPIVRMMSFKSDIDIVNDAILEICRRVGDRKGDKNIYNEAKKIFDNMHSSKLTDKQKIDNTENFYKKYGKIITDVMYMLNTGSTDEDSYLNKLIFIEKDEHIDENGKTRPGNNIFKKYYEKFDGYMFQEAQFDKTDLMDDAFVEAGVTSLNMYKVATQVLGFRSGAALNHHKIGTQVWAEIKNEFKAITFRQYYEGVPGESKEEIEKRDKEIKEKILMHYLRQLISGFLDNHGASLNILTSYNQPTGPFAKLNERGIFLKEFKEANVNSSELRNGTSVTGEALVARYAKQIILNHTEYQTFYNQEKSEDIGKLIRFVKAEMDDNLDGE